MKKIIAIYVMLMLSCFVASCANNSAPVEQEVKVKIHYTPDASKVKNPIKTITTLLEEQPPAYGYIPTNLEVTERAIKMTVPAGGTWFTMGVPIPGQKKQDIYYYKTLGIPVVSKPEYDPVWNVQIVDKYDNVLYWLFTDTRENAERFADALYYMILHHK